MMGKRVLKWKQLPQGLNHAFDPSGNRIAFSADADKLVVQFANRRQVVVMEGRVFYALVWATTNEIVTISSPISMQPHRELGVVSLHPTSYHPLFRVPNGWSLASRALGQVSYIGAIEMQYGLYIINTKNLSFGSISEYAFIWDVVDVLPSGGHSWGPTGDYLAFIGVPKVSRFRQQVSAVKQIDYWQLQSVADQMFRDNPPRLYIAAPDKGVIEIAGSEWALEPLWVPKLPILVFRKARTDSLYIYNLIENQVMSVIDNLFLMPVMHPEGFLYYRCGSITDIIKSSKNINWKILDLREF